MTSANRGTKRRCAHCGATFYDLDRSPVVCPKCHTPYVEAPRVPTRPAGRARAEPVPALEPADDEMAAFDEDEVLEREGEDEEAADEGEREDEDRD